MEIHNDSNNGNNFITISKSFHDLTNIINKEMLVYPGDPKPDFSPISTIKENNVNVSKIILGSHTGTHVDAPLHFEFDGDGISAISMSTFIGDTIVLDMSNKAEYNDDSGNGITFDDFERYSKIVDKGDIVLVYTGSNDLFRRPEDIMKNFSYIEPSGADWIVEHGVKCIGIDSFSVEKYNFVEPLTHKKLLSKKIGIIENVSPKLKKLIGKRMYLICTPLPLEGLDGSPARVLAFDLVQ
ncbi:MAG: cyclase family protein [Nitrososphaeraceae archaeon]